MNLDKLKALIRLANNNPNDNEANLAARKACRLLAQDDFALLNGKAVPPTKDRPQEPFWRRGDPFYDFFVKYGREGGPKRSYDEETKKREEERNKQRGKENYKTWEPSESQKRYWTDSAPHVDAPEDNDWGPFYKKRDKQEDYDWVTGKRKRRQELRVCSKCGLETMTFRTDEVPWICNPCHWKEGKK